MQINLVASLEKVRGRATFIALAGEWVAAQPYGASARFHRAAAGTLAARPNRSPVSSRWFTDWWSAAKSGPS